MERIVTSQQMKSADYYTINTLAISEEELINRAGYAVASEILKRFKGGRVLVCIGKGNNGEDGKVISRILGSKHGFSVCELTVSNGIYKIFDRKFDIIVDCIFGTGLNKNIEGKYYDVIDKINHSGAFVVSCDIPSGLNADTGLPMGISVRANLTVAIQEYKLGHFLNFGPDYCGKTISKDIGISLWEENYFTRLNLNDAKRFFPELSRKVNKGSFGKSVVVGGSIQYSGSVLLSLNALTSLKMGNGYSALAIPKSMFNQYFGLNPECIIHTIEDSNGFCIFDSKNIDIMFKYDCISIGMGMGVSEEIYYLIKYILKNYSGRLVIDADGINTIAKYGVEVLDNKKCEVVVTPHVKEFSRLIEISTQEILANPIQIAKDFAKKHNLIVLLKDSVSIITDGNRVLINTYGCSGMAKAGSGDLLSGILCGVLAKKLDILDSVGVSAMIFGLAGEKRENDYTLTASEIISFLPKVIEDIQNS